MPNDIYRDITDTILEGTQKRYHELEMPWHRNSHVGNGWPINALTGNAYSGVNVLSLWAKANRRSYTSSYWATYKQWQTLGAQVDRGEKGTPIVFFKPLGFTTTESEEERTRLMRPRYVAKKSKVFNADQVNGYAPPTPELKNLVDVIRDADDLVEATKARIIHYFDRAYYHRRDDQIFMPERERFTGTKTSTATESYYAVLLHELTHWSGHESRLNRDFSGRFGTEAYAMEELVAELGAAFLCADLGVSNGPRPDHAAYIATWLTLLSNDSRAIFSASSKAGQAATYLKGLRDGRAEALSSQPPELNDPEDIPF